MAEKLKILFEISQENFADFLYYKHITIIKKYPEIIEKI